MAQTAKVHLYLGLLGRACVASAGQHVLNRDCPMGAPAVLHGAVGNFGLICIGIYSEAGSEVTDSGRSYMRHSP